MTTMGRFGLSAHGVWVVAALTCAIGVGVAVFWPREPLPGPRSVKAQEARWSVPAPLLVDSDRALSIINRRPLWALSAPGTPGATPARPDDPPLTPPDWRIVATVISGTQRLVLVSMGPTVPAPPAGGAGLALPPRPPEALRVGDQLPGGARIVEIRPDGVCLSLKGRHVFLSTTPQ